jgi:N-acyl-D-amino-acid deacylase
VISHCQWDDSVAGKTLADVARSRGGDAGSEDGAEAALWITEQGDCEKVLRNQMSEADIERILKHPATMIASDGEIPAGLGGPNAAPEHPRSYGTFARVLGLYVRERKLITLEEAVRKMSSFPAQRLGSRVDPDRFEGRYRGVRSRARARYGHLRQAASICRRRGARHRQWPDRFRK